MLEAHAPHHAVQSWRDFFVHIATIVVGLIIAVALEQSVEFVHHRDQRLDLEDQMRSVFDKNVQLERSNSASLGEFRTYLIELQHVLAAAHLGQPVTPPGDADPRSVVLLNVPSLAPYQAAKENGTVALLSSDRIRMYNRIESQDGFVLSELSRFNDAMAAVNSFLARFEARPDGYSFLQVAPLPDPSHLTPAELDELQARIGTLINATDLLAARLSLFTFEVQVAQDNPRDDDAFLNRISAELKARSRLGGPQTPNAR